MFFYEKVAEELVLNSLSDEVGLKKKLKKKFTFVFCQISFYDTQSERAFKTSWRVANLSKIETHLEFSVTGIGKNANFSTHQSLN